MRITEIFLGPAASKTGKAGKAANTAQNAQASSKTRFIDGGVHPETGQAVPGLIHTDTYTINGDKLEIVYTGEKAPIELHSMPRFYDEPIKPDLQDYEGLWTVHFMVNGEIKITGGGNAIPIFNTVLDSLDAFIKKTNPLELSFTAAQTSSETTGRIRFYRKLLKRLNDKLKSQGYAVTANSFTYDGGRQNVKFTIKRQN